MFKFISPIPSKFYFRGRYCQINQFFGENKSTDPDRTVKFYGPNGHNGWDISTKGTFKFLYNNIKKFLSTNREKVEIEGTIPICAAHDGYIVSKYNDDRANGIYVRIRDAQDPDYETLYFHLDKIRVWKGDDIHTSWEEEKGENFVKAGTVIGYSGNTGKYTTGAHLHFMVFYKGVAVDPMPYSTKTVYMKSNRFYFEGQEISKEKAELIINY